MPFSISALFRRYCDFHFWISRPGFALPGANGAAIGHVDRVHHGIGSVQVDGWSVAAQISLAPQGKFQWETPNITRHDVAAVLGHSDVPTPGFRLQCHSAAREAALTYRDGDTLISVHLPEVPSYVHRLAKLRLGLRFVLDCAVGIWPLLTYLIKPSTARRQAAKRALRMIEPPVTGVFDASALRRDPKAVSQGPSAGQITIIVPVYNALDHLKDCLRRVEQHTDVPWRMIMVEDCSSDQRVRPWVTQWAQMQCAMGRDIQLLLNPVNQGFVVSVNSALRAACVHGDHVVLLNSDALVPENWASRLMYPIMADDTIASVTPLSNDAEILSAPLICVRHDLHEGDVDQIDRLGAQRLRLDAYSAVPTGVGFCMAMNARFLQKTSQLDTVFGKGYGEEVDWCLRSTALGGVHVAQPALFVEHVGGASFGTLAKQRAIARSNTIITQRYPGFDASVQRFMASDPLKTARIIHAIALAHVTQSRLAVYVAHNMGGGAELYLSDQLARHGAAGEAAIVLRVGGPCRWKLEYHAPEGVVQIHIVSDADLRVLLMDAENFDFIYSCAVGHPDPTSVPALLCSLAHGVSNRLRILVHDYFCVSEAYTLLDDDDVFSGIAPKGAKDAYWRAKWNEMIAAADQITCFSHHSRSLMSKAYPGAVSKIDVRPHAISNLPRKVVQTSLGPIGILGDIGRQKGADIVSRLSRMPRDQAARKIAVIGRLDPAFALGSLGVQTGAYRREAISHLAEEHALSCWLIPSIWPETFSYTTHEALATGLPVFTFDLGAQAEAAEAADNGHVMPLEWVNSPEKILIYINGVINHGAECRGRDQGSQRRRRRGVAA